MSVNGQNGDGTTLRWTGKLFSADDIRAHVNGHRELLLPTRAILTPLAHDELKTRGIIIRREDTPAATTKASRLGFAQERPDATVQSAIKALERDGIAFTSLQPCTGPACDWARDLARCIAKGTCEAGVAFCADAALVACVANKVAGLRAASIGSVAQATRALLAMGANLLAVEMPGRTFFEIRQILRSLATSTTSCPPGLASTLKEVEHAHR